jgi:hypothetical protein
VRTIVVSHGISLSAACRMRGGTLILLGACESLEPDL